MTFVLRVLWAVASFVSLQSAGINRASVTLTVEGGLSLVDPHCPGTLQLTCKGTALTVLRWRYNGDNDIHTFSTADLPTNIVLSGHPAFIYSSLQEVTADPGDQRFGNFTSILTLDLEQLQGVMNILCGDPGTTDSIPVNITVKQPTIPSTPRIISVTANYQSTMISSIELSWGKLETDCSQSLIYQLSIESAAPQNISQSSCGQRLCTAVVNTTGRELTEISLRAVNEVGASGTDTYPTIEQMSGQYYTPQVNIADNCVATAQCVPGPSLSENSSCSVQYTSDPTYMDLSDPATEPLNNTLQLGTLQPNTAYYFSFSTVDNTLEIRIQLEHTSTCNQLTIVGVVVAVVVVLLVMVFGSIVIVIVIKKIKKKSSYTVEEIGGIAFAGEVAKCSKVNVLPRGDKATTTEKPPEEKVTKPREAKGGQNKKTGSKPTADGTEGKKVTREVRGTSDAPGEGTMGSTQESLYSLSMVENEWRSSTSYTECVHSIWTSEMTTTEVKATSDAPGEDPPKSSADKNGPTLGTEQKPTHSVEDHKGTPQDTEVGMLAGLKNTITGLFKSKSGSSDAPNKENPNDTSGTPLPGQEVDKVASVDDNATTAEKPPKEKATKPQDTKGEKTGSKPTADGTECKTATTEVKATSDTPGKDPPKPLADKDGPTVGSKKEPSLSVEDHKATPQDTEGGMLMGLKNTITGLFKSKLSSSDAPNKENPNVTSGTPLPGQEVGKVTWVDDNTSIAQKPPEEKVSRDLRQPVDSLTSEIEAGSNVFTSSNLMIERWNFERTHGLSQ